MYAQVVPLGAFLLIAFAATGETVTIRSGNGAIGTRDSSVTFLQGPATGDFPYTLTSTDFSAAQNGPAAFIVTPNPPWISGLSEDSSAKWIGTNANANVSGNTALYASAFQISAAFSAATLTLHYASDDTPSFLGGFFLNGTVFCQNQIAVGFSQEHTLTCDIGAILQMGTNWLYLNIANIGGSAGLLFSATITTTQDSGSTVPTISSSGVVPVYSASSTIQPGEWVSIYGNDLMTGSTPVTWTGNYPINLGGTTVTINGKPAYLSYAAPTLLNLQAPDDTARGPVNVVVTNANGSATATVMLADQSPSFSLLGDGKHVAGIILRSNGSGAHGNGSYDLLGPTGTSLGYATVAAKAGDSVVLFGVGFGPTNPAVPAGEPFSGAAAAADSITVTINGVVVTPAFAGMGAAGQFQFNLTIPPGLGSGDQPLLATVNGVFTQSKVVIALESIMQNPQPAISSLSPSSISAGSGPLTLAINGSGLIPSSAVTFNGVSHVVSFVNGGQLDVTLTASDLASAGTFPVIVTNPPPGGGSSSSVNFNVSPASVPVPPAPTGLSPGSASPPGPTVSTLTPTLSWNASTGATGYTVVIVNTTTGKSAAENASTTSVVSPTLTSGNTYEWGVAAFNSSGLGTAANPIYFTVVSAQTGLTGTWQGSWTSDEYLLVFGTLSANLTQSGSTLTGTASYSGSQCFSGGNVTGTINGSAISATISVGGGQTVSLSATANSTSTSIVGTYRLSGGACAPSGDAGTFSLTKSS